LRAVQLIRKRIATDCARLPADHFVTAYYVVTPPKPPIPPKCPPADPSCYQ
jgi:hypothetical protein